MHKNILQDVKNFHKLHPQKKITIVVIICFVFLVSIIIGMAVTKQTIKIPLLQQPVSEQTDQPVGELKSNLSISADKTTVKAGDTILFTVTLDGLPVQVIDCVMSYDSSLFSIDKESIQVGDAFNQIIPESIKFETNVFKASASVDFSNTDSLKTGTVLTFSAKTLKPAASAKFEFLTGPKNTTAAKGGENKLGTTQGVTITIEK